MSHHRITLAALGLVSLVACGGGTAQPTTASPAPSVIKSLTFLYVPAPAGNDKMVSSTDEVIQNALSLAGYAITTNPQDPHDATILVSGSVVEKKRFMTVTVNGQVQRDFEVHALLTVKDGDIIAGERSAVFDMADGEATQGDGFEIVNGLTGSLQFRDWAARHNKGAPAVFATAAPR